MKKNISIFFLILIFLALSSSCVQKDDTAPSPSENETTYTENGKYAPIDAASFIASFNSDAENSLTPTVSPVSFSDIQTFMLTNINTLEASSLENDDVSFSIWQRTNKENEVDLGYYLVCKTDTLSPRYYALNLFDYKLYFWGSSIGEGHTFIDLPAIFKTPLSALLYIKDVMCADSISFYENRPPLVLVGSSEDPFDISFVQTEPFEFSPNMFSVVYITIYDYTDDCYRIRVFEIIDDFSDTSSPSGHTATWGWYTVYKWGIIKDEIIFNTYIVSSEDIDQTSLH